jgi:hypothetical protein
MATYCKFSDLGVVNAKDFSFLAGAEAEAWNQVHDEEDDTGTAKGVGETGDGIGELVTHLDPVVVEPAARDDSKPIKMRNIITECGLVQSI